MSDFNLLYDTFLTELNKTGKQYIIQIEDSNGQIRVNEPDLVYYLLLQVLYAVIDNRKDIKQRLYTLYMLTNSAGKC